MTANEVLCLVCSKVAEVLRKEKYGKGFCKAEWDEIYKLYSYYISLFTGCELDDDYLCDIEAALNGFDTSAPTLTETKTCAIALNTVTVTPSCPVITIAAI